VTALVKLREGKRGDEESLRKTAAEHIAAYKLPKLFVFVDEMVRAPSGKADYCWAKAGHRVGTRYRAGCSAAVLRTS
jgi:acyl-CoA synthetase (AMP-forming)/AMP-acid ligase II